MSGNGCFDHTKFDRSKDAIQKARDAKLLMAPERVRKRLARAWAGKSKAAAIASFCLECVGYDRKEVALCTSLACPLWEHRPVKA